MATPKLFQHGIDKISDVETLVENINNQIKDGATVSSWNSEGTSVTYYNSIPLDQLLSQAKEWLQEAYWFEENGIVPRSLPVRKVLGFYPL